MFSSIQLDLKDACQPLELLIIRKIQVKRIQASEFIVNSIIISITATSVNLEFATVLMFSVLPCAVQPGKNKDNERLHPNFAKRSAKFAKNRK